MPPKKTGSPLDDPKKFKCSDTLTAAERKLAEAHVVKFAKLLAKGNSAKRDSPKEKAAIKELQDLVSKASSATMAAVFKANCVNRQ